MFTPTGLALSNTCDMGGSDCPANTGEASSFITESNSLQLHRVLMELDQVKNDPKIMAMYKARSGVFGSNNRNSRIVLLLMYSDDLVVIVPLGLRAWVKHVVHTKGMDFGMIWTDEKYGELCIYAFLAAAASSTPTLVVRLPRR